MRWPGHKRAPGVAPERDQRPEDASTHLGHATPRRHTLSDTQLPTRARGAGRAMSPERTCRRNQRYLKLRRSGAISLYKNDVGSWPTERRLSIAVRAVGGRAPRIGCGRFGKREDQADLGSGSVAFEPDSATMGFDDGAGDREAETRSGGAA
jgi:hypothetical protein